MPILTAKEIVTEAKVTEYAYAQSCISLKLNVLGRVGWPDRLYLFKGSVIFIEFKREGQKPRRIQDHVHAKIRSQGFRVFVVDSFEQGCRAIDDLTHGNQDV